ncbi:protein tantalus [Sitodiplosis mosellana]|uniref:protein tantalus n=1 Tax=Sitodiplosis mosellana TaxID=263140 RepID=UPI00244374C4|nr:protein tantalus [Sitodiplosis mosellana]
MLSGNATTLKNIIHLFNHKHLTLTNDYNTTQALRIVEKSMSTLDLSEPNSPDEFEKPTEKMMSNGIGARIMRRLRQNSTEAPKAKTELKKKNLNPNSKAIEKLYLNKSLGRIKYTQLETIYEHEDESDSSANATIDGKKVFGKKTKRSVACTDGLNTTKTLKEKRKRRIKKIFGVHKKFKSISMKNFLERLQSSETVEVVTPQSIVGA